LVRIFQEDGPIPPSEQTGLPRDLRRLRRRPQRHSSRPIRPQRGPISVLRTSARRASTEVRRERQDGRGAGGAVREFDWNLHVDGVRGGVGERVGGRSGLGEVRARFILRNGARNGGCGVVVDEEMRGADACV